MPKRATKRGEARTPIGGEFDVLVCGASFAGLSVARELAGADARVLVVDRYEIGERQTSACAAPTAWLEALELTDSMRQTFGELVVHMPHGTTRMRLPWTFSTFDYRELCELSVEADRRGIRDREGRRALRSDGPHRPGRSHRPAGRRRARVAADAGGRRLPAPRRPALARPRGPPRRRRRRARDLDRPRLRPGGLLVELPRPRRGQGRRRLVRPALPGQGARRCASPTTSIANRSATRATGSRTGSATRPRTGSSSAGDSAGHCLPLTAEGIRTAFYFGIACGRELRAVVEGSKSRGGGAARLRRLLGLAPLEVRVDAADPAGWCRGYRRECWRLALRGMGTDPFVRWSFRHYLNIAPPEFAGKPVPRPRETRPELRAAA